MHSVRALLAVGVACAGSLSRRLAFIFAVPTYRHHGKRTLYTDPRRVVSSSPPAWLEAT